MIRSPMNRSAVSLPFAPALRSLSSISALLCFGQRRVCSRASAESALALSHSFRAASGDDATALERTASRASRRSCSASARARVSCKPTRAKHAIPAIRTRIIGQLLTVTIRFRINPPIAIEISENTIRK